MLCTAASTKFNADKIMEKGHFCLERLRPMNNVSSLEPATDDDNMNWTDIINRQFILKKMAKGRVFFLNCSFRF